VAKNSRRRKSNQSIKHKKRNQLSTGKAGKELWTRITLMQILIRIQLFNWIASHQSDGNLPPFWASRPPLWAHTNLHFSMLSLENFSILTLMRLRIQIQLFHQMMIRIRNQPPKIMRIYSELCGSGSATLSNKLRTVFGTSIFKLVTQSSACTVPVSFSNFGRSADERPVSWSRW